MSEIDDCAVFYNSIAIISLHVRETGNILLNSDKHLSLFSIGNSDSQNHLYLTKLHFFAKNNI